MSTVYFFRDGEYIKIGTAIDVEGRRKSFQTGNPREIEILGTLPGGRRLEHHLHKMFEHYHFRGEWFHTSEELIQFINKGEVPNIPRKPVKKKVVRKRKDDRASAYRFISRLNKLLGIDDWQFELKCQRRSAKRNYNGSKYGDYYYHVMRVSNDGRSSYYCTFDRLCDLVQIRS